MFAVDPADQAEADKLFWDTAAVAVKAGMPLGSFLRRSGWTEDEIAEYEGSPERQSRVAGMEAATLGLETLQGRRDGRHGITGTGEETI